MLKVTELHAGYGRIPILNGVNLDVAEGQVLGILGHNGMGKTTLIKTLMGFIDTTQGTIQLEGQDITRASPNRRARAGFGYVPQGRDIFPRMTVRDNLRFAVAASGSTSKTKVDEILDQFQRLAPLMDREGGALSGGEQQILAIARCLCANPKLMFLDEPTEGIQPSIIEQIAELLSMLKQKSQLTIVLVEQNLEFVSSLSDRVAIIQKGTIVNELAPSQLGEAKVLDEFIGVTD
jgi:branched-chain amino acid transport system ATP-binding protein